MELHDGKFGMLDFLCRMLDFGFWYQTFDCGCLIEDGVCLIEDGICLIEDGVCLNVDGRF